MPSNRNLERDHQRLKDKIWDEIKKINWHEINEATQKNFSFGVAGTENEIEEIMLWLKTNVMDDFIKMFTKNEIKIELSKYFNQYDFENHIIKFNVENGEIDRRLLLSTKFCITFNEHTDLIRSIKSPVYVYEETQSDKLVNIILTNHKEIELALSHNIPVFRRRLSEKIYLKTALQNLSWAVVTAAPNAIPGAHLLITLPIAAISDFLVLTANEIKMLYELVGANGSEVKPESLLPELGIVFLYGGLAKNFAGNVAQLTPVVGIILKGAIAYAFTASIGAAILFYYYTGHKMTRKIFRETMKQYKIEGEKLANEKVEEIKEQIKEKQKEKKKIKNDKKG